MVQHRRLDSLSSSSQQYLKNAFDDIRFGFHNCCCIFGACPGEILHMVLLGWFKYEIESFFVQAGSQTGETVKSYNTLCNNIASYNDTVIVMFLAPCSEKVSLPPPT
jgi:hypothetical protein